jgi:hypothetical protein
MTPERGPGAGVDVESISTDEPWSVWAASLFQATMAALAIVGAYALYFLAVGLYATNSITDSIGTQGFVLYFGAVFGLPAALASGAVAAFVIVRRRARWSAARLRAAVAATTFVVCLLATLATSSLIFFTFPLPFIAAGIAAWRTGDLARPERRDRRPRGGGLKRLRASLAAWWRRRGEQWPTKPPPIVPPKSPPTFRNDA